MFPAWMNLLSEKSQNKNTEINLGYLFWIFDNTIGTTGF
jgi:hypothetical protein